MTTYNVSLKLEANNPHELTEKLQAFQDLQDNLDHEDLMQAVEVVVENPEMVEFIKEVTPEDGQELSLGDYLNIAKKAFSKFG